MTNDVALTAQTAGLSVTAVPLAATPATASTESRDVTDLPTDVTITPPISHDDVTRAASPVRRRLGLLGEHDFRQLFIADSGSQLGTQVGMLALPLVAAVTLHATAFEMGVVSAADTLPFLLASLPAGALVDRVRRRPVMIVCDLARAATLISIPVAWWLGTLAIWQVVVVAFVLGMFSALFDVAYQSVLPQLVSPDKLVEGNAKLQSVAAVSQIGGPAAAGFVIRALTAPVAVGVNALTYLSSAAFLSRIRTRESRPERGADSHFGRDIIEGLRFVGRNPLLRAIAAEAGSANFFSAMSSAMLIYLSGPHTRRERRRDRGASVHRVGGRSYRSRVRDGTSPMGGRRPHLVAVARRHVAVHGRCPAHAQRLHALARRRGVHRRRRRQRRVQCDVRQLPATPRTAPPARSRQRHHAIPGDRRDAARRSARRRVRHVVRRTADAVDRRGRQHARVPAGVLLAAAVDAHAADLETPATAAGQPANV